MTDDEFRSQREIFDSAMRSAAEVHPAEFASSRRKRRERIATAVLAGLLANPGNDGIQSPLMVYEPDTASLAVRYADALIAELDKEP